MSGSNKILWGEGLFLRPQHFQQQDLYHERRLAEQGRAVHPYLWGVRGLKLDLDALGIGILRVNEMRALLPDGEAINAPEEDELPDSVNLESIDNFGDSVVFHIVLPCLRLSGSNFSMGRSAPGKAHRFYQEEVVTPDRYTNGIEFDLSVLRKSFRLMSDRENRDQYVSLPIARILNSGSGTYALDNTFVPPVLTIRCTDTLYFMIRRLMEILQAKAHALYRHHREPSESLIEFRAGDSAAYWLLHTVNAAYASLQHFFHHPGLHPERLFHEMLKIAAQLLTCSKAYALSDLPAYDHANPGPSFARLDMIIRELMETVIAAPYVRIPLAEQKAGFHTGRLETGNLEGHVSYYVSVAADMPPVEIVEAVPRRFKVGAAEDVDRLVSTAMPGLRLVSAVQVPSAIPVRPGCYYFSVESHGALYSRMLATGAVTIYAPGGFNNLKLEFFAVAS